MADLTAVFPVGPVWVVRADVGTLAVHVRPGHGI